jgi:hypothetical protein
MRSCEKGVVRGEGREVEQEGEEWRGWCTLEAPLPEFFAGLSDWPQKSQDLVVKNALHS